MDQQHDQGRLRVASESPVPDVVRGWRHSLRRWRKDPAVRKHVRSWLLGLVSFGPIY